MRFLVLLLALLASPALAGLGLHGSSPSGGAPVAFALPTGDVLHYMNPSGNDGCNGTSPSLGTSGNCAWLTPNGNAALKCGDVIIAAPGNYDSNGYAVTRQPTSCPSTTGGIDGTGGIYFTTLLCGGSDLGSNGCKISMSTGATGFNMTANYWAVEGWNVTGGTGTARAYEITSCSPPIIPSYYVG